MTETKIIPVALLIPPSDNPRVGFDEAGMNELIDSIRQIGLRQPLCVRPEIVASTVTRDPVSGVEHQAEPRHTGRYLIDAGERRYRACLALGMTEIKCEVETDLSIDHRTVMLHENAVRTNLTPFEEGQWYCALADEPGMTEDKLQQITKQKLAYIYARMELLKGDEEVSLAVHRGEVSMAVARELNLIPDEAHRRYLLKMAAEGGCSARQMHGWRIQWEIAQGVKPPPAEPMQMPLAQAPITPEVFVCALCGQSDRTYDLENVYICRNELRAIKASMREQEPA